MFTILWDNDGVLVDTEGLYFRACRDVLRTVGVELTREQYLEISLRRGQSTLALAAGQGFPKESLAAMRAERDRRYVESLKCRSPVIDGVAETLRLLHGRVRMGVVTSTTREHFAVAHAHDGLSQYFEFVVTREDCQHSKPHPEPYLTALARHGLCPAKCIAVEDSQRGVVAATTAGLECLVVRGPWSRDDAFPGAAKVLDRIADVPDEVLRRGHL